MDSRYDHLQHEDKIYAQWEQADAFNPDAEILQKKSNGKPFSIILPPPNANDPLHIGHAMYVVEDVLIRYHRMLGDDTLWLPGTDHAGIETQFVFEKKLKKEGSSRFQFDRQTLFNLIWDYVQENSNTAKSQLKKLGFSLDWSRFKFTLDPQVVETVLDTFQKLYDDKLLYRDMRLVNYCPKCGTGYSDLEVKHVEKPSQLHYLKYGPFTIATARIETKFRDTALAANPNDPRYKDYIGKSLEIQGLLGPITMTVIADEEVDPEFGTGIMKVTPAHDPHDFELGKKYNLPVTPIIDFNGRMDFSWYLNDPKNTNETYRARAEKYHGKKVAEARELMLEDLKADGLFVKTDDKHVHSIGTCYRCGTVLEPLPLPQFFISVKPLVEPVLAALDRGDVTIHGSGHDKILKHWLTNLKDWNISRQIVWGIRLPIWYDVEKNPKTQITFLDKNKEKITGQAGELLASKKYSLTEIKTGLQELRAPLDAEFVLSPTSPGDNYLQETDTFDTWFSSGQWPFATLKTAKPGDFDRFYPTSVMETGYDILPFWVMRMLMLGNYATGQMPFKNVYLHGLVRDQKGQKMSKSKGNVVNPLEIIEKYGADALRMALVIRSSAGLDKSVGDPDFKAMRNFTNKIWNAARFVLNLNDDVTSGEKDAELLQNHQANVEAVTQRLADYKIGYAADWIYDWFWHTYCDRYIELAKSKQISRRVLVKVLEDNLKLLHPFMPFVTEAIWQEMIQHDLTKEQLLISTSWPTT